MLGIAGALLAALPLILIPAMKVVLTRTHPPAWMTGGMVPQSVVVVLLCCFIVGVTISVEQLLKVGGISYLSVITELGILAAGVMIGVLLALLARRKAAAK